MVVFDALMMMVEGQADPEATVDAAPTGLTSATSSKHLGAFHSGAGFVSGSFVSYLEQLILSPRCEPAIVRAAGAILLCVGASLCFSDTQTCSLVIFGA